MKAYSASYVYKTMDKNKSIFAASPSNHDNSLDFINRYVPLKESNMSNSVSIFGVASDMENYLSKSNKEDDTFCSERNFKHQLKRLDEEVQTHGFSTLLDENNQADLPSLLNCIYGLLQRHSKMRKMKEEVDDRYCRLDSDNDHLTQNTSRLKENLESAQREICLLKLKEKQLLAKTDSLLAELKGERDEIKRMKSDMQFKQKQFWHEVKRNEKEMTKLKERLHQAISSKGQTKMGLEALRTLQKSHAQRGTWKSATREGGDMYHTLMTSHEERKRELMAENLKLRGYISEVQAAAVGLIAEESESSNRNDNNDLAEDEENVDPIAKRQKKAFKASSMSCHLEMPFESSKQEIEKEFQALWQALRLRLSNTQPQQGSISLEHNDTKSLFTSEIGILKEELNQYKELCEKQENVLKSVYDNDLMAKLENALKVDGSPSSHRSLEIKQQLLKQERERFEADKNKLTEFAISVSKEKELLNQEKVEFYKHCISTPVITKENDKSHKAKHSTPANDHLNRVMMQDATKNSFPTTDELYRFMSVLNNQTMDEMKHKKEENRSLDGSYLTSDKNGNSPTLPTSNGRGHRFDEHINSVRKAVEKRITPDGQTKSQML